MTDNVWKFDKDFSDYWKGGDTYRSAAAYQPQWQQQLSDTINKITNRDKFSYDVNGDALYQQYKDKYVQQGKMAMQDTMGQAAAMTGGYGNSYAATVGNQAYQAHLNNLNNVIPELYQMAYDRYKQEGQDLYNQYSLFAERDKTDYGRYIDDENAARSQWNADRTFAYGQYLDDRDLAYDEAMRMRDEEIKANAIPYLTDYDEIEAWTDRIRDAKTEAEALIYIESLERIDPYLADSLYKEWMTAHGLSIDPQDTTVPEDEDEDDKKRGGGGKRGSNIMHTLN